MYRGEVRNPSVPRDPFDSAQTAGLRTRQREQQRRRPLPVGPRLQQHHPRATHTRLATRSTSLTSSPDRISRGGSRTWSPAHANSGGASTFATTSVGVGRCPTRRSKRRTSTRRDPVRGRVGRGSPPPRRDRSPARPPARSPAARPVIASTPDPQPRSTNDPTAAQPDAVESSSSRHRRVVACAPVPNACPGSITTSSAVDPAAPTAAARSAGRRARAAGGTRATAAPSRPRPRWCDTSHEAPPAAACRSGSVGQLPGRPVDRVLDHGV